MEGIFTAAHGRLQTVAVAGAAAPGVPSGTLAGVDSPVLNDRGDVAFLATVRRGRETAEAIYVRTGGKLRKVVAQGDPAPAGGAFAGFGPPALDNRGAIVFVAFVEGRAVPGGIFLARDGQLKMLVGAGDDTPLGGIFTKFSERAAVNDAGLVAFHAVVKGAGDTRRVFVAGRSGIAPIAAIGDALPGGGKLATLTLYPVIALGPTGALTFAAVPTPTGDGAEGVYIATPSR